MTGVNWREVVLTRMELLETLPITVIRHGLGRSGSQWLGPWSVHHTLYIAYGVP